jgi:hypothetical protein
LERDVVLFEIEIFRIIPRPPKMAAGSATLKREKNMIELCKLPPVYLGAQFSDLQAATLHMAQDQNKVGDNYRFV